MNWRIDFRYGSWIHPEDAATAIRTRLVKSLKRRKRIPESVLIEDLFIASLVNNRPWSKGQSEQLRKYSEDKKFCERLSRAFATDRPPTWKKIDILILSNWRELHVNPKIQAKIEAQEGKLPGLQDWSPKAIAGLFQLQRIDFDFNSGNFEEWFTKRRKRLGLSGKYPHEIKDFIVVNNTLRIVR